MDEEKKPLDEFALAQRQLFALIRLAIGQPLDPCLQACKLDWHAIYSEAEKQALVGIAFAGIEHLPKDRLPDMDTLMDWLGQAEYIKSQNENICAKAVELTQRFRNAGFNGIILKGCGIGQLYNVSSKGSNSSKGLSELRTSGDIDIWEPNHSRKEILQYLRSTSESKYMVYHNAEYPIFEDVSVEVHFTPSWFWNPFRNKRFQDFCKECADDCIENNASLGAVGEINVPTLRFNRVFILQHIYRHLFGEGIGLRQLLDYYFVLKASDSSKGSKIKDQSSNGSKALNSEALSLEPSEAIELANGNPFWAQEKVETMLRLKELGMEKFTAAVMWVLGAVFEPETMNLEHGTASWMLCEPDEKEGKYLLNEIMIGGNFGHYDERNKHHASSALGRFWHHVKRDFRYIHSYPGEVLWVPVWKVWHYFWRKMYAA